MRAVDRCSRTCCEVEGEVPHGSRSMALEARDCAASQRLIQFRAWAQLCLVTRIPTNYGPVESF